MLAEMAIFETLPHLYISSPRKAAKAPKTVKDDTAVGLTMTAAPVLAVDVLVEAVPVAELDDDAVEEAPA